VGVIACHCTEAAWAQITIVPARSITGTARATPYTHGGPLGLHPKSIFFKDFYIIYKIKFLDNNY
jgi:hypothetical protein